MLNDPSLISPVVLSPCRLQATRAGLAGSRTSQHLEPVLRNFRLVEAVHGSGWAGRDGLSSLRGLCGSPVSCSVVELQIHPWRGSFAFSNTDGKNSLRRSKIRATRSRGYRARAGNRRDRDPPTASFLGTTWLSALDDICCSWSFSKWKVFSSLPVPRGGPTRSLVWEFVQGHVVGEWPWSERGDI